MKGLGLLFLVGLLLIVSRIMEFIIFDTKWIALVFFVWGIMMFISIHNKNKERNIPRPVYLTN